MKLHCLGFSLILTAGYAATAFAADAVTSATPTTHQMMKECVERQKTADVTMSKSQMHRICKDELKRQKETGSMPTPPTDVATP